jgi:hypothetical protein
MKSCYMQLHRMAREIYPEDEEFMAFELVYIGVNI